MKTYTITIDEQNTSAKHFLALMKTLPFISFSVNGKKKKSSLEKALDDIKMGRMSGPMTMEEFKMYTQKIWNEA